jgi:transposase-like protein
MLSSQETAEVKLVAQPVGMSDPRKSYTPELKLKVVLESMQRDTTQEAVCKEYGISSSMLHR